MSPNMAMMGWSQVVYIKKPTGEAMPLRVKNYGIARKQQIQTVETVQGYGDVAGWHKGPAQVEGDISFPLFSCVSEDNAQNALVEQCLKVASDFANSYISVYTTVHPASGQLSVDIGYVNRLTISVNEGAEVNVTASIFGVNFNPDFSYNEDFGYTSAGSAGAYAGIYLQRQIMYDSCGIISGGLPPGVTNDNIISLGLTIDNKMERYYTMSPSYGLAPAAYGYKVRDVGGDISWQSQLDTFSLPAITTAGMNSDDKTLIMQFGQGAEDYLSQYIFNCKQVAWNADGIPLEPAGRVVYKTGFKVLMPTDEYFGIATGSA